MTPEEQAEYEYEMYREMYYFLQNQINDLETAKEWYLEWYCVYNCLIPQLIHIDLSEEEMAGYLSMVVEEVEYEDLKDKMKSWHGTKYGQEIYDTLP